MHKTFENISLTQDNGQDLTFRGNLYSECSWFDEDEKQLTRQKLYITDNKEQIYYIVRSQGDQKTHHAYRFSVAGETCTINNGKSTVTLPFDMLMHVVRGMCGLKPGETPSLEEVEVANISNG
ncbi:MAG: hypothetical protein IKN64_06785 [Desulfovibrio sp.]|nr:hypothetical protein [Desulfovibrio sp.]